MFKNANRLLELLEDFSQKVLKAQGDVAVSVVVVFLKYIRHALEGNTALNKQVKAHDTFVALVVGVEEKLDKLGAETVSESNKGVAEFGEGDVAAAVDVEAVEQSTP